MELHEKTKLAIVTIHQLPMAKETFREEIALAKTLMVVGAEFASSLTSHCRVRPERMVSSNEQYKD